MVPAPDTREVPATLERRARRRLEESFGAGGDITSGVAPGRCTLVGDHVDYAGGLVLCAAIDLYVAVGLRATAAGADRVLIGDAGFEREDPLRPRGAGYVFAAADALRARGLPIPSFEAATAASLPAGAGLASSAAVIAATQVALLRLRGTTLTVAESIDAAYAAEHDILGVPSGRLDEHAIVESPDRGAILLDCAADAVTEVPGHWRMRCSASATRESGTPSLVRDTGNGARRPRLHCERRAPPTLRRSHSPLTVP